MIFPYPATGAASGRRLRQAIYKLNPTKGAFRAPEGLRSLQGGDFIKGGGSAEPPQVGSSADPPTGPASFRHSQQAATTKMNPVAKFMSSHMAVNQLKAMKKHR